MVAFFVVSSHAFEIKSYEKKVTTNFSIRNLVEKIPRRSLEETLREFIRASRPSRVAGSAGNMKAQAFLEERLLRFSGDKVQFFKKPFKATGENKKEVDAVNFIWEKAGVTAPSEVIILTAHYDTLLRNSKTGELTGKGEMPGADNNGSGVALLLSMIEILNQLDLPKTVRIIFLDAEELNSQGSKSYAESPEFKLDLQNKKIVGVLSLSMLGHDSKLSDLKKKQNNMKIYTRPKEMENFILDESFAQKLIEAGKRNYNVINFIQSELPQKDIGIFASTPSAFWGAGLPAIVVTQDREDDLNPRFMTSNDFIETLNFNTYANVFKYVTSAVLAWNYDVVK